MNSVRVSRRLHSFDEYVFSRLERLVKEIENITKKPVLNFGPGDPDIAPSSLYLDKLCELIKSSDAHLYPGFGAGREFTEALIFWYRQRFGVSLTKDELHPLLGAKDGVSHLPLALLDTGDEVLVPDPGYPGFSGPAVMIGAKTVGYASVAELKEKISRKTKLIWVNFPSNPTGQVATLTELEKIVALAKKHNILIAYDNAYSEITFDGYVAPSILQVKGAKDIAVELGSFSKTFSLAGFRMGWIVGNSQVIKALAKVKSQMDSGLAIPLQSLGAFILTHFDKTWYQNMIDSYQKKRDIIANYLKLLGLSFSMPKGGLYIWAKIPDSAKNAEEFCMQLLENKQILVTPGTAFGKNGERFVRISICVNIDDIENYF